LSAISLRDRTLPSCYGQARRPDLDAQGVGRGSDETIEETLGDTSSHVRELTAMMDAASTGLQYVATLTLAMLAELGCVKADQAETLLVRVASVLGKSANADLRRAAIW
jgi:hypothetical protein